MKINKNKFEILCTTMHQKDFSKVQEMNIHSDVVFANQADRTSYDEFEFEGHIARMITTDTRGVGVNRNLALMYAKGEVCLLADDDVTYDDDMEQRVLAEFDAHPDADIMIFHFDTDSERKQIQYSKTKKYSRFGRMPWGACRIACRLDSVRKANLWFTTLFGGGCVFPAGEDSMWLADARRKGLTLYVSKETIGTVFFEQSTWFTGYDEKYYYGQGALYYSARPHTFFVWLCYSLYRTRGRGDLTVFEKAQWILRGRDGYRCMLSFDAYRKAALS